MSEMISFQNINVIILKKYMSIYFFIILITVF